MKIVRREVPATFRAYSVVDVKALEEFAEHWTVKGVATTPRPDRIGDIVEPLGATFAPDIPMLWMHNGEKPVGRVELGSPTKKSIPFSGKIPKVAEAGALKDRIDEAVQSIKYRLVAAVSIGFRVLNNAVEFLDGGGLRFLETEIMELSLVTIPAQPDAVITGIKSFDAELLLASEQKRRRFVRLLSPGVSGSPAAKRGAVKLIPRK
jgi:HK97 family phage prohead protease